MINHPIQPTPVSGYYEYLSQVRYRVNVTPHEETNNEKIMAQTTTTTTTTSPSIVEGINNHDNGFATNVVSSDNSQLPSLNQNDKDVTKWSSVDVQRWIDEQCKKFELKKATTEKFQMNGQALILLTKHDFLRRSPDGGEILYYALQRLIKPNTSNTAHRIDKNGKNNGSYRSNPRIVEIDSDTDERNSVSSSSPPTKPIIEEPDDPPLRRRSDSDSTNENHQHYSHSFFYNNSHFRPHIFTMPSGTYYHQHPNTFMYAHHHHHHPEAHPHMHQQQFYHPQLHPNLQFLHPYYPMMVAQGITIEAIDNEEANNLTGNGINPTSNENSANGNISEQLYLITMNGQRYVVNEEQIRQYAAEFHQQQQQHQQQQHFQQQQQHFQQQQQQHFHQQQQFQRPQQQQQHTFQQQTQQQHTFQPQQQRHPPPPPQENGYFTT